MRKKLTYAMVLVLVAMAFTTVPMYDSSEGTIPEGMVSYWRFDEGSGTTVNDAADANHGTIYGASWTSGLIGDALSFDGVDDYVEIPAVMPINYDIDFTISTWINASEGSGDHWVIRMGDKWVTHAFMAGIQVLDNYVYFACADEMVIWERTPGFAISDNEWYHIVGTNKNRDMRLYVNGVLQGNEGFTRTTTTSATGDGIIGRYSSTYHYNVFDGLIDEVAIWDRALSPEEIQNHYINGLMGYDYFYVPPDESIQNLFDDIQDFDLTAGTENSLLSKLDGALDCLENGDDNAARNILNAFINAVEAQSGKKLTVEQADTLIEAANDILATI